MVHTFSNPTDSGRLKSMQRIATKVFIIASVAFGIIGIVLVLTQPASGQDSSDLNLVLQRLMQVTVFVILPSFALSVAGKYLSKD